MAGRMPRPEHLHDLRRRVVEHHHQMDLVEPLWPRLGKVWAEEAQRLRNQLGACQGSRRIDESLTAPHEPACPVAITVVAPNRGGAPARPFETAQRLSGRLFAEKPKAFRRRIAALWSARNSR